MEPLRVTLVQQALHWEDRDANLRQFSPLLAPLAGTTDLIVLPEMFTTGFTMAPEGLAEEMDGPSIAWMREHAALIGAALTGSLIIREEGHYYNRLVWMYPNGDMHWYDKRHLFTLAGEHQHYRGATSASSPTGKVGGYARWCATTSAFPFGAATTTHTTYWSTSLTFPPAAATHGTNCSSPAL